MPRPLLMKRPSAPPVIKRPSAPPGLAAPARAGKAKTTAKAKTIPAKDPGGHGAGNADQYARHAPPAIPLEPLPKRAFVPPPRAPAGLGTHGGDENMEVNQAGGDGYQADLEEIEALEDDQRKRWVPWERVGPGRSSSSGGPGELAPPAVPPAMTGLVDERAGPGAHSALRRGFSFGGPAPPAALRAVEPAPRAACEPWLEAGLLCGQLADLERLGAGMGLVEGVDALSTQSEQEAPEAEPGL